MDALDRTDGDALGFEHGTLFDVQFDERVRHQTGARMRAGVADAVELVTEPGTIDRGRVERGLDREPTRVHEAAEHVGRESGAFLVREERHREWSLRLALLAFERLDHFETREDAVVAVEAPAGAHGVDVRAAHDGRKRLIEPGALADDVPDGVDADVEAEILHPGHHQVPARAVLVGEREARGTAALDGSDLREIGEPPQQAIGVDVHRFLHRSLQFVKEAVSIKGLPMIDER